MSIALSIPSRGEPAQAARLVPVATQDVFKRYWLPACAALGLRWVPLFETGVPLDAADIGDVLAELRALKSWTEQHSVEAAAVIGERLARLIAELEPLARPSQNLEVFIG